MSDIKRRYKIGDIVTLSEKFGTENPKEIKRVGEEVKIIRLQDNKDYCYIIKIGEEDWGVREDYFEEPYIQKNE